MATAINQGYRGNYIFDSLPEKGCGMDGLMTFVMLGNYVEDKGVKERFSSLIDGKYRVLRDKQRDVLLKRVMEGKNLDETAIEMNLITREAVRQKLREAVSMLFRKCWDDYVISGKELGDGRGPALIELLNQGVLPVTTVNSLLSIGYRSISDIKGGGYGRLLYAERIGKPTLDKLIELAGMRPEDLRLDPEMNLRLAHKHGVEGADIAYVLDGAGCKTLADAVEAGEGRVSLARGCGEKRRNDIRNAIREYCGEDAYDRYINNRGLGDKK